ncbi:MAG: S8 family serine peptidase, partial [Bdellovibrionales bacterium]|nr:S8 family serine peptidase [Bdellovibrionales bacterium]
MSGKELIESIPSNRCWFDLVESVRHASRLKLNALLFTVLALVLLPSQLLANEVYANQYIVDQRFSVAFANGGEPEEIGTTLEKLGGSESLIVFGTSRPRSEIVDESATENLCPEIEAAQPGVVCSPNYVVSAFMTPDDTFYSEYQEYLRNIEAPQAWDRTTGDEGLVIAVIDTGVDYSHPDLADNMWVNPGEIADNGIDDDKNGYIDDVHGINAITDTGDPMDDHGHGTHVAGTIAARTNNNSGIAGVMWNAKIMGLKFLSRSGAGSTADAIKALRYVIQMKESGVNVRITNNSWGGGGFSQNLYNAIEAAEQSEILFVAAAGNNTNDNDASPSYPASYELGNIVSVAATEANG